MISIKHALSLMVILSMLLGVSVCFGADNKAASSSNPVVVIETSMGDITLELFKDKAPKSVENFLEYVKAGYYGGTIFHRVIKGFMIQGGGLTEAVTPKSGLRAPIVNESSNGLKNDIGTISMARTNEMNSATSQFFINTRNNGGADTNFAYAVFGKVTNGMDIVKKIESAKTGTKSGMSDVPVETITIKSVKLKGE
jgi:peptidyl-prolyl cis-trans isomerase A (cyclophilin A)